MKFSIFYVLVSLTASVAVGTIQRKQITANPIAPVIPATHYNVTFGPKTIVAAYPVAGIDFTLKFSGMVAIGSDSGLYIRDADVFQLSPNEWTADMGEGKFVTVNVATGETNYNIDGKPHTLCPEVSNP